MYTCPTPLVDNKHKNRTVKNNRNVYFCVLPFLFKHFTTRNKCSNVIMPFALPANVIST